MSAYTVGCDVGEAVLDIVRQERVPDLEHYSDPALWESDLTQEFWQVENEKLENEGYTSFLTLLEERDGEGAIRQFYNGMWEALNQCIESERIIHDK